MAQVGVLTGNGNHCDFIAALFLRTELARGQIAEHYGRLSIRPARSSIDDFAPTLNVDEDDEDGRIVVRIVDAGHSAGFDWRCH